MMIKGSELRDRYLRFFEKRAHSIVPSDGLIPSNDPTVLFTSAGMNQFKDYFLGRRTDLKRAASCQKCLRTGDLDNVGKTPSHHSFFEMLGNFSFGDYFKKEAIQWAWEFLTGTVDYAGKASPDQKKLCLALPAKKLWISIYEEDEEAFNLWRALGIPAERIKRMGQKDNFWPSNAPKEGPNGPCGPCSEIYFDADGAVDGPKSVEVWNLVFTQFDRQPDSSLKPLPKPNIDTGMGLERLTRVIQGVANDYETDLFAPIVETLKTHFFKGKNRIAAEDTGVLWTIADHVRAVSFLLSEKLLPSNEGRGYVLRMLIRRAHWHGARLWADQHAGGPAKLFLAEIAGSVFKEYAAYPELKREAVFIRSAIGAEEQRFAETLEAGGEQITAEFDRLRAKNQKELSGDFAFKMKDTYGYPLELLADIAQRSGFTVNQEIFSKRMEEQRERSRAASQFGGDVFVTDTMHVRKSLPQLPAKEQQFVGYEHLESDAVINGLWDGKNWVNGASAGEKVAIVLDRSPFYGESGGQVGDGGVIEAVKGLADVHQTTWVDDVLIHHATIRHGSLKLKDAARARVDAPRRLQVARSHTGTHLLHWALRKVLGQQAAQAGSLVEPERLRFDVSSLQPIREEQLAEVQILVNARVRESDAVSTDQMAIDAARRAGAIAMFGEKYGQQVRVVKIGDYSMELCGGTHLLHTGFIGTFEIVAESSIASGTRRIEALVGGAAAEHQRRQQRLLQEVARRMGRSADGVVDGLEELLEQLKQAERERKGLQMELAKVQANRLVAEGKQINGVTLITSHIQHADRDLLTALADAVKGSLPGDGVVLLASSDEFSNVAMVMATTNSLSKRIHAGQMLKAVSVLTKGSGGGRPEFAQAGGRDPSGIPAALKKAEELVREALTR